MESNDSIKLLHEYVQKLNKCPCKFLVPLKLKHLQQFRKYENLNHKFQILFSNSSETECQSFEFKYSSKGTQLILVGHTHVYARNL